MRAKRALGEVFDHSRRAPLLRLVVRDVVASRPIPWGVVGHRAVPGPSVALARLHSPPGAMPNGEGGERDEGVGVEVDEGVDGGDGGAGREGGRGGRGTGGDGGAVCRVGGVEKIAVGVLEDVVRPRGAVLLVEIARVRFRKLAEGAFERGRGRGGDEVEDGDPSLVDVDFSKGLEGVRGENVSKQSPEASSTLGSPECKE